jgi:hypothetical protein
MPPRDPSLPEGTDHIIDTNIDLGDSGGADGSGGGAPSGGSSGGVGGSTANASQANDRDTGSAFKFDADKGDDGDKSEGIAAGIAGQIKEGISGFKDQATDRVRTLADDGKAQASSFLQSIAEVLSDAASSIEEKLGDQYAGPGHSASDSIRSLAGRLDDSSVEDLFEGAKGFVKKSPALAIGAAALIGFAVARVLRSSVAEFRSGGQDDGQSGGQRSGGAGSGAAA